MIADDAEEFSESNTACGGGVLGTDDRSAGSSPRGPPATLRATPAIQIEHSGPQNIELSEEISSITSDPNKNTQEKSEADRQHDELREATSSAPSSPDDHAQDNSGAALFPTISDGATPLDHPPSGTHQACEGISPGLDGDLSDEKGGHDHDEPKEHLGEQETTEGSRKVRREGSLETSESADLLQTSGGVLPRDMPIGSEEVEEVKDSKIEDQSNLFQSLATEIAAIEIIRMDRSLTVAQKFGRLVELNELGVVGEAHFSSGKARVFACGNSRNVESNTAAASQTEEKLESVLAAKRAHQVALRLTAADGAFARALVEEHELSLAKQQRSQYDVDFQPGLLGLRVFVHENEATICVSKVSGQV